MHALSCRNRPSSVKYRKKEAVMSKITLLDGATGTMLWGMAADAGLEKVSVWRYNKQAPQIVKRLHSAYLEAGSDIIYTNTFTANGPAAESEGFSAPEIIELGIKIAKEAVSEFCSSAEAPARAVSGRPFKRPMVALDFGPLLKPLEPFGPITEDECRRIYAEMMEAGKGADLVVLETFMDAESLAIAAGEAKRLGIPVLCSMSFHKGSRTFFGADIDSILEVLKPLDVDAVGLNCSFGPENAVPVIKEFAEKTSLPLLLKPNTADLSPEDFAAALEPALPLVSYLGSCCGSSPEYIKALKRLTD